LFFGWFFGWLGLDWGCFLVCLACLVCFFGWVDLVLALFFFWVGLVLVWGLDWFVCFFGFDLVCFLVLIWLGLIWLGLVFYRLFSLKL